MGITLNGTKGLAGALDPGQRREKTKAVIRSSTAKLDEEMTRRAVFKGHYIKRGGKKVFVKPTGATKRSIRPEIRKEGMEGAVGPHTHYAPYLEFGTRFMGAQPFVKPALDAISDSFARDIARAMRGKK